MAKIRDIPKTDRPRERFMQKGPDSLSKIDLLAIMLGSGIKGKNARQLAQQIIAKFGKDFLRITVADLQKISGIGQAKALQIAAAISLVKRFYEALPSQNAIAEPFRKHYYQASVLADGCVRIKSRRYLGNKYKLLGFIEDIIADKCESVNSLCDIFAGTGVVGEKFNTSNIKVISNDFLAANYVCLRAFLGVSHDMRSNMAEKITHLNHLPSDSDGYFSRHFGGTYFSEANARKIGAIREEIDAIAESDDEKNILLCALLYAVDKVANTVGHYDAFRKKMDMLKPIKMLLPDIDYEHNANNEIYKEDANALVRKISCDVLYIDPPYNSRQYSDAYHVLENLVEWHKPEVSGIGKKMDRSHIKSTYCLKDATRAFADLIEHSNCAHILFSYNNTGASKDGRSNARMNDAEILQILNQKGDVEIFEKDYKAFATGKSNGENNAERIFYCKVR